MDFKIFLSHEALSDLERLVALNTHPERGRVVPEFRQPDLREIVFRSYRIIYRVDTAHECLEVARFWHAARGFPQIPRGG